MSKIKYMGSADRFVLPKGTDWDGRLATATTKDVVFDKSNKWTVDPTEAGLSAEAVELLLEDDGFKDVDGLERIPSNDHQRMFLGHGATRPASNKEKEAAANADEEPAPSSSRRGRSSATTVGGSTPGD